MECSVAFRPTIVTGSSVGEGFIPPRAFAFPLASAYTITTISYPLSPAVARRGQNKFTNFPVDLCYNTEKKVTQPTHCLLENEGLSMSSMALAEQIFTIDKSRILKYLGHLAPEDMQRLDYALKNSLALNPLGSIRKLKPIIRSTAAYAPPEVVDGKPPVYPYTPIQSSFEDAGSVEEMMLYTELQSAVHAMIQRLEYSFTFNPSLLTIPKRKQQVSEILAEAEKYIWRIREEMQCD